MPDAPVISIITVVLNEKQGLQRSIDSIAQQRCPRLEHLIIDGGSTDGTLDIIKANRKRIDFWMSEPDRGISDAFNKGVLTSKGDVIGILNAGDWYERDALRAVSEALAEHPDIDVICGAIRFWEKGDPQLLCHSNPQRLEKETSVYHPAVFVKKTSYLKYGTYDESYRYAMDYELLLRFKRQGAKFLSLDKTLANMTLDGISQKKWYPGLNEVRRARSMYFPRHDVLYYHTLAILKNLIARTLKKGGLRRVHQAYWQLRNQRVADRLRGAD
jgi:glycosyltransferase involved in cell wall biosynthesis